MNKERKRGKKAEGRDGEKRGGERERKIEGESAQVGMTAHTACSY